MEKRVQELNVYFFCENLGLLGTGTSILLTLSLLNLFGRSQLLFNVSNKEVYSQANIYSFNFI